MGRSNNAAVGGGGWRGEASFSCTLQRAQKNTTTRSNNAAVEFSHLVTVRNPQAGSDATMSTKTSTRQRNIEHSQNRYFRLETPRSICSLAPHVDDAPEYRAQETLTSARVMPNAFVATSLEVIPPLESRNRGLSVSPATLDTKAVPTRSPKTRPPDPSPWRGTPRLVYRITSRPRERWRLTLRQTK